MTCGVGRLIALFRESLTHLLEWAVHAIVFFLGLAERMIVFFFKYTVDQLVEFFVESFHLSIVVYLHAFLFTVCLSPWIPSLGMVTNL